MEGPTLCLRFAAKIAGWKTGSCCWSSGRSSRRASPSPSARRGRDCRCLSSSSVWGCCWSDGPGRNRVRRPRGRAPRRDRRPRPDPLRGRVATSWRRLREVAVPAALLSTVGVIVSTLVTGAAAKALFDLPWVTAALVGAVVASTDAAAVFATLRFTHIKRRLARTLEAESGGNDPMAIALTLGLIAWIEQPDTTASTTSLSSSSARSASV